jgi:hypothetical protein
MAMRQRPKVANYSARNELKNQIKKETPPKVDRGRESDGRESEVKSNQPKTIIPKKLPASNSVESKRVRHASSGKPIGSLVAEKPSENGGVMTQFRNLDDIPDITEDYNPFEAEEVIEEDEYPVPVQQHRHSQFYSQSNISRAPQPMTQQPAAHHPPPLPQEVQRGKSYQKCYSDPEEESEIEEESDIPKLYHGKQNWDASHQQSISEDDWNSDDDDEEDSRRHLPPLPAVRIVPLSLSLSLSLSVSISL